MNVHYENRLFFHSDTTYVVSILAIVIYNLGSYNDKYFFLSSINISHIYSISSIAYHAGTTMPCAKNHNSNTSFCLHPLSID